MPSVQITDVTGDGGATTVALPDELFDVQANIPLMHQVVVAQLAAARQGTHKAKNRGEVSGGGKKPYRQKGTGRARQGSTRAPQFTGGGTVHGPVPHTYLQRTPKKMKAAALRGALSDRARDGHLHVLSGLGISGTPSTKQAVKALAGLTGATGRNVLVVVQRDDELGWKSLRNVPSVHLIAADQLNTYDVLVSDDVVFTRAALEEYVAAAGAQLAPQDGGSATASTVSTVSTIEQPAAGTETSTTGAGVAGGAVTAGSVPVTAVELAAADDAAAQTDEEDAQ
ncbi:hypothetical protein GCM10011594_24450 [Nakamurella endophytica]|uniref:Large ribosomal subunit protein uL4 n=1 Tax=Nakamurella endophytica TaxID=1748367 RepID=A0A917WFU0_9ACTN|nr:hypothetical protein GCM10011594_24450 [Nakamurella endophytica]